MTQLLTSAQMRAIEQAAIDSGRVTGLELMERAGRGVMEAILEEWPHFATAPHHAVVLCGPGNNGGDGFVIARLLRERGWDVDVFLHGDLGKLPPDASVNAERWRQTGVIQHLTDERAAEERFGLSRADLLIDALFGTGLSRPVGKLMERFNSALRDVWTDRLYHDRPLNPGGTPMLKRIAVDIPSGLCADSGRVLSPDQGRGALKHCLHADLTVTFHLPKVGHVSAYGPELCGEVRVVDIGLGKAQALARGVDLGMRSGRFKTGFNVSALSKREGHKYGHGHALVMSGGVGRGGAARLAARAALRIGAGLVTVAPPPAAMIENAARLDAIMLRAVRDAEKLAEVLEDVRINALCLGPGLGLDRARALLPVALQARRATVLDADALSAFTDAPGHLLEMLHRECVLTPHMGEFARLFPDLADRLAAVATSGPAYSKADAVREAAVRAGCTVLLKGADTVVADPSGVASVNASAYDRAAPWLATAGSGDVLAGFTTGLLARGFAPHDAAATAAYLHTECALEFGPGLIAEDLPEQLPAVLRRMHANSP